MTIYKRIRNFAEKYERLLIPGMLVSGLVVDVITFRTISVKNVFILLVIHAIVAGAMIAFINLFDLKLRENRRGGLRYLRLAAPLIVQFNFGALLSATLIFYWFSGSIAVSWPFIIIVAALMGSNDVLRHYFMKPLVQISVYFFVLFTLFSVILPFLVNSIAPGIFMASGVLAAIIIYFYVRLLAKFVHEIEYQLPNIGVTVIITLLLMNTLYFLNFIPPIPLSLRDAGIYHNVERDGADYKILAEKESLLDKLIPGQVIRTQPGEKIFVYTSIFAPADLNTKIVHDWEFYDVNQRKWVSKSRLSFGIAGGRQDGYRGFSFKTGVEPGKWRVSVETERGQVLGRIRFRAGHVREMPELIEEIR